MIRFTEAQVAEHKARVANPGATPARTEKPARPPGPRFKSDWERRFAELLDLRVRAGELTGWVYEGIHLRLPGDVMYRVDFVGHMADGTIALWEIKGRMRPEARIKIVQAVTLYPGFVWHLVRGDMIPIRLQTPADLTRAMAA